MSTARPVAVLVEDNPTNRKLVHAVMTGAGWIVHEASDATSGIELTREHLPDIVLMDIQLPDMDGMTAVGVLRSDEVTRDIPILAITAHAMPGDAERMVAAGCSAYLAKPIRYKQLLELVTVLTQGGRKLATKA